MRMPSLTIQNSPRKDGRLSLGLQRGGKTLQAFGKHRVVNAHSDAKVIGHLEKLAGNDGRLEFRAESLQQFCDLAM